MSEYRFGYTKPIPPGRVLFRIENKGRLEHRLALLPLSDDVPPIDVQLRSETRRPISPYAGTAVRRPGELGVFAVDLVREQRYAFICFVRDSDGKTHAIKGMSSEFRAGLKS